MYKIAQLNVIQFLLFSDSPSPPKQKINIKI